MVSSASSATETLEPHTPVDPNDPLAPLPVEQAPNINSELGEAAADQGARRREKRKKRKKPKFRLGSSNILSQFLFIWVFKLLRLCRKVSDIRNINFLLNDSETARETGDRLEAIWQAEVAQFNVNASLLRALTKAFGRIFIPLALWKLLWACFTWIGSFWMLQRLVMYKESLSTTSPWRAADGHLIAFSLFVCSVMASLCFHQLALQNNRIGIQSRAALMVLIYRKSLRLSYVRGGVGDIVNLISNECNRIAEACVNWHFFWSAGLECAVLLSLAIFQIGVNAIPALVFVLVLLLPLQYAVARHSSRVSYRATVLITKRVHLMSEILTAIKLIKFYAWEDYYRKKVSDMREKEIKEMGVALFTKVLSFTVVFIAPVIATAVCILPLYRSEPAPTIQPHVVFTLLSLFNTLRYPLMLLPNAERSIAAATISLKKLEEFFLLPEVDKPGDTVPSEDPNILMTIDKATFVWDGDLDHPHIVDLSLVLKRNSVIGVVGDVGSGRSLLAAIMGQIKRTQGTMSSYGSTCGYIPQEPWLINATLRDNILFGLEPNEEKYVDAIRVSGLTDDFLLLSNGDETFISKNRCVVMLTQQKQFLPECDLILVLKGGKLVERGTYQELKARNVNFSAWVSDFVHMEDDPTGVLEKVNEIRLDPQTPTLSGGKQINPLSPPSPHAGPLSHLRVRTKKNKTRSSPLAIAKPITAESDTFNQNQLKQLIERNANSMQNAQLNEETVSKLIERNQLSVLTGNMSRPPANFENQDMVSRTIEANQLTVHSLHEFDVATLEPGLLSDSAQVRTFWSPYREFIVEKTGLTIGVTLITVFFVAHVLRFLSDVWLAFFVENSLQLTTSSYLVFYCGFCIAIAIAVLLRGFAFSHVVLQKSVSLHNRLIKAVLGAPMAFYDITPLGHVLSFFARHLFQIDEFLPETALQVLSFAPLVIGIIVLVSAVVPWFWATLPVYGVLGFYCVRTCLSTQRKFQQLEASNKSPMFAHLSTTLEGLFSIRLYCVQERFDLFNRTLIDADHKALYSYLLIRTLMALCLDLLSSLFIYISALFVVLFTISPAHTGLAVSNSLQLLLFVPWFVKMTIELHSAVGSVSSVIYFGDHVPREERENRIKKKPDPGWPSEGEIEFQNITLRYHRYGVNVLKSVSFHIQPREKIAIVGRSENGKTFSLSERQLFCIARAIIIKTSIVVFDEPTTSVDKETELLLLSVIHENFANCTVIVLASRFRVIVQMDKVMVMSHGRAVEFDTPLALMDDPKSKFSLMLAQNGDLDPEKLRALAQAKADAKAKRMAAAAAAAAAMGTSAATLGSHSHRSPSAHEDDSIAGGANWDMQSSNGSSTRSLPKGASSGHPERRLTTGSIGGSPTLHPVPGSASSHHTHMPRALEELFGPSIQQQRTASNSSTGSASGSGSASRGASTEMTRDLSKGSTGSRLNGLQPSVATAITTATAAAAVHIPVVVS
eukprot:jgi/Hompol1/1518/HPOL_000924-RA